MKCSFCGKREGPKIQMGQSEFTEIYCCKECWDSMPDKLIGLPVKYKGKVVGSIVSAEKHT